MSRRVINRNGTARAAVVGATTGDGTRLREALAESGVPGSRVDLYAPVGGEALISEYAGEATSSFSARPARSRTGSLPRPVPVRS